LEYTLHKELKDWYAEEGDEIEVPIGEYVVDIIRGDILIELQTGNFSAIKEKLYDLLENYTVRLVHPLPYIKWIIRLDNDGEVVSRRKSPKRGRTEDVFWELVYLPELLTKPSFELETLLVNAEEVLIDDGQGSWRRKGWSVYDWRLVNVKESQIFTNPSELLALLPRGLLQGFTTRDLANKQDIGIKLARKMCYCLRRMGVIEETGKRGRANLYRISE
jgi:hypothetical protein